LEAIEATTDEMRTALLDKHAKQVRDHMNNLAKKSYWSQFENSPEFVVMFLPGESFFSMASMQDPHLIEDGMKKLDDALMNLMELTSLEGKVLAEMVHAALLYGEKELLGMKE